MGGHLSAHILGAENLAKHAVARAHIGLFLTHDIVEQSAAAQSLHEAREATHAALTLRALLETAEHRRQQRADAGLRLRGRDAHLRRDGFQTSGLSDHVLQIHP